MLDSMAKFGDGTTVSNSDDCGYVIYGDNAMERFYDKNGHYYSEIAVFIPGQMNQKRSHAWRLECEIVAGRLMRNVNR